MNYAKIRGKLAESGMSQKELAYAIGITPQSLSRKITGKRQFTVGEAATICQVLSVPQAQRAEIFLSNESQICNSMEAQE